MCKGNRKRKKRMKNDTNAGEELTNRVMSRNSQGRVRWQLFATNIARNEI
jgi:hypothetical protein